MSFNKARREASAKGVWLEQVQRAVLRSDTLGVVGRRAGRSDSSVPGSVTVSDRASKVPDGRPKIAEIVRWK